MPNIKARLAALADLLRVEGANIRKVPYEELDPISQAIVSVVRELDGLDTPEKRAAYCERYGMSAEQLEDFIRSLTVDY